MSANNNSCLTENNNQALLTRLTSSTARCIIRGKAKGQECFPSTHVVPQKTQINKSSPAMCSVKLMCQEKKSLWI